MGHRLGTISLTGAQRIQLLAALKWGVLVLPTLGAFKLTGVGLQLLVVLVTSLFAFGALRAWEISRRRQYIRESRLPPLFGRQITSRVPAIERG